MGNDMNQGADGDAALRMDANSADQPMSPKHVADEALQSMPPRRSTTRRPPNVMPIAHVQALEAYVERRRKLAAKIRLENPARTEEEIEARLEQFGA